MKTTARIGRSTLLRVGAGALVLLMGAVGCSSGRAADGDGAGDGGARTTSAAPASPRPAAASAETNPSAFLPIAKYSLSAADSQVLSQAQNLLMKKCLAGYGLDWGDDLPTPSAGLQGGGLSDRVYGVTAADDVGSYGYHRPPVEPPVPKDSPELRLAVLGPAGVGKPAGSNLTLKGKPVPGDGCQGEAQRSVLGDTSPLPGSAVAETIDTSGYRQSMRDPAVVRAFASWSQCMKKSGFSYPDPVKASEAFTGPAPSAREKKVAVADVACKQQVSLVQVWFAAESRLERAMIAPKTAVLAPILTRHQQQVARAKAVIAQG